MSASNLWSGCFGGVFCVFFYLFVFVFHVLFRLVFVFFTFLHFLIVLGYANVNLIVKKIKKHKNQYFQGLSFFLFYDILAL